jgi:hypothetical protein
MHFGISFLRSGCRLGKVASILARAESAELSTPPSPKVLIPSPIVPVAGLGETYAMG